MHLCRGHVSATRSGVQSKDTLERGVFFDILFLELIQLLIAGLLKDLDIEALPAPGSLETFKLLNKLCTA